MLAAHHDQENVVALGRGSTKNRALTQGGFAPPKTPGGLYPKTPLRIPLNDENGTSAMGGKGMLATKGTLKSGGAAKQSVVTPMGARRAPLGDKTTNAKAISGRPATGKGAVAGFGRTATKPSNYNNTTAARRHKTASPGAGKTNVFSEEETDDETEIEYAPRPPAELPYESDVFPDGILTFEGLKSENLFRGYFSHYYGPVVGGRERGAELLTQEDPDSIDWSVSDVPETRRGLPQEVVVRRAGATAPSKRAASSVSREAGIKPAPPASQRAGRGVCRPPAEPAVPAESGPRARARARARARSTAPATVPRNATGSAKGRSASGMAKSRPASSLSVASIPERPLSVASQVSVDLVSIDSDEDAGLGRNQSLAQDTTDDFELRLDD